ncbi:hypothetical protein IAT38_005591 [Cryptococcus sp. DSM 104549]
MVHVLSKLLHRLSGQPSPPPYDSDTRHITEKKGSVFSLLRSDSDSAINSTAEKLPVYSLAPPPSLAVATIDPLALKFILATTPAKVIPSFPQRGQEENKRKKRGQADRAPIAYIHTFKGLSLDSYLSIVTATRGKGDAEVMVVPSSRLLPEKDYTKMPSTFIYAVRAIKMNDETWASDGRYQVLLQKAGLRWSDFEFWDFPKGFPRREECRGELVKMARGW